MSEHTPEPWITYDAWVGVMQNGGTDIDDGEFKALAWLGARADARRIVACVNACAGIETETLESPGLIAEIIGAALAPEPRLGDSGLSPNPPESPDSSVAEAELSRYKGYYKQAMDERDEAHARAKKAAALLEECVAAYNWPTATGTMENAIERARAFLVATSAREPK